MTLDLFRLVDEQYDPIAVGARLVRCSDHSNQKLGNGMYFALTEADARGFAATRHRHKYTHLLGCRLEHDLSDFFDLRLEPNAISQWWDGALAAGTIDISTYHSTCVVDKSRRFSVDRDAVGFVWESHGSPTWSELVLLAEHAAGGVEILSSEVLCP